MWEASPWCGCTGRGKPDALDFFPYKAVGGEQGGNIFNEIRHRRKSRGKSRRGAEVGGGAGPTMVEPVSLGVQAQLLPGMLSLLPNPVACLPWGGV